MKHLQISAIGPVGPDGRHITGDDVVFSLQDKKIVNVDKSIALHQAAESAQVRNLQSKYGVAKVHRYSRDELAKRALADDDGKDDKDSGAYLNDSFAEQCERLKLDPDKMIVQQRAELQARGLNVRGLDGGTDTSLVGVDYNHEWYRELRLAGTLLPQFSRQMDIRPGYFSWTGPVVGDSLWLKQGPLTSNSFTVNTAFNPTSTTITLTPQKSMAVIFVSGELTEDSLAPIMENLKTSMIRGANVMIENVLLNGDTATGTGNINSYAVTALGSLDPRLMMNGLRAMDYYSTVGKSSGVFSGTNGANGITTLDGITAGLQSLDKYADDPTKILTIMPKRGEFQTLRDTKARPDTFSALLTASTGRLQTVSGSKINAVGNSLLTNSSSAGVPDYASALSEGYPVNLDSSGLYSGTGNTRSGFVQCREDNIVWGWKRQFTFKVIDLPLGDQVAIACSMRFVFTQIIAGFGVKTSFNYSAA